ncbi:MAG: hypothetical protein AABZ55_00100, partial [Bdellovibrionota bacterium]
TANSLQSDVDRYNDTVRVKTTAAESARAGLFAAERKLNEERQRKVPEEELMKTNAEKLFSDQEKLYYDANLLLTDVGQIKMGLQYLKASMGDRINNTLLGIHINNQIQKLASNICAVQDKCAAGKAGEVQGLVEKILGGPPISPQSSDRKNPEWVPVEPMKGETADWKLKDSQKAE